MKFLKVLLVSIYVIIILLLLLSLVKCEHKCSSDPQTIRCDTVVQERDTIPQKVVIKEKFKADVVMCIDCTGSMGSIINTIKNNALTFYSDLKERCISHGKEITSMRIKVIGFRDLEDSSPFEESVFYAIPEEKDVFCSFVSRLRPIGGGDGPERGYDALAMAMHSDWTEDKDVHQIIILWTDEASHPLNGKFGGPGMEELTTRWKNKMNQKGKRLILFVPEVFSWNQLVETWDKTTRHDVSTGGGLSDVDYDDIINTLSENI